MITATLIEDEIWAEAPSDPQEAFLFILDAARNKLLAINSGEIDPAPYSLFQWRSQYVNELHTVAEELGVKGLMPASSAAKSKDTMDLFDAQLARVVTKLKAANRELLRRESVALPLKTKEDLRSKLEELRAFVIQSNISDAAKQRLHDKIDLVEKELDKKRSDLKTFWVLAGAVGAVFGTSVSTLASLPQAVDTVNEVVEAVHRVATEEREATALLEGGVPPLQIEDKRSDITKDDGADSEDSTKP